jgi:hypothetical protein
MNRRRLSRFQSTSRSISGDPTFVARRCGRASVQDLAQRFVWQAIGINGGPCRLERTERRVLGRSTLFGGKPELAPIMPPPEITSPLPSVPLGRLECRVPGREPFSYRFTADDLVTTARFLVGEAGGVDNPENRGTLWAMLNRYAFFRNKTPGWGGFGGFLEQYSQTLQPYIRRWESVKELVQRCNKTFDNPDCRFRPTRNETYPGTQVPMGQLASFLELQATPWSRLPERARSLALGTLTGKVPNPIGNATEVDDTKVYFRREKHRNPTRAEWEAYTRAFARRHGLSWRPEQVPYDQFGHDTLFVTAAAKSFPEGATRIVPPGAGATGPTPPPSPTPSPSPAPTPTPAPSSAAPGPRPGATYDGKSPAPGTVETRRSFPTSPPVRGDASQRSAPLYDDILNQFAVGVNPRYAHRSGATFCNIFVWDVTGSRSRTAAARSSCRGTTRHRSRGDGPPGRAESDERRVDGAGRTEEPEPHPHVRARRRVRPHGASRDLDTRLNG